MVSVELDAERAHQFHDWYEEDYLPKNVADVPSWVACRRYSSEGREPARHLAIYEAFDLPGLDESLDMMRAPFRMAENMSWKRWTRASDRPSRGKTPPPTSRSSASLRAASQWQSLSSLREAWGGGPKGPEGS